MLQNLNGFEIVIEGDGEYQSNPDNAHGAPTESRPVFLSEIIKAKKDSNNLRCSRPNMLLVNGLGVDFQNTFFDEQPRDDRFESCAIDEVWIAACGIDETLQATDRFQRLVRRRFEGSGM